MTQDSYLQQIEQAVYKTQLSLIPRDWMTNLIFAKRFLFSFVLFKTQQAKY